jgi:type VI secretion system protein ImpH
LKALNELVRLYLGLEHDYEFIIRIYKQDKPKNMMLNKAAMPVLGWNSWLTTRKNPRYRKGETEDIRVSAIRYR